MSTKEERERIEWLQGTLDLLILLGPAHGHAIAKAIEFHSDEVLQVEQGLLYPSFTPAHQATLEFRGRRHFGEQPARQVLPANARGSEATEGEDRQVGQTGAGDRGDSSAGGIAAAK